MATQRNRANFLTSRIYDCDSIPVANPNIAGLFIVANVVGVLTKLLRLLQSHSFPIVTPKLAVSSRGDIEPASLRIIVETLRLSEPFDFGATLSFSYINSFYST